MENENDPQEILEEVLETLVRWHEDSLDTADYVREMLRHGAEFDKTYPVAIFEMHAHNFEQLIEFITNGGPGGDLLLTLREVGD